MGSIPCVCCCSNRPDLVHIMEWIFTDETFYLATAKRFSEGDLAIKYDWNTAQIFGLLLVPVYRIYTGITGSNEGIIIFMRILLVLAEWLRQ